MKHVVGFLLFSFFFLGSSLTPIKAQSFAESALTFSRTRPGGSARIQAMGGAQVSLGGDYSSALSNPAGLGMYNKSEFAITPSLNFNKTTSNYFDNTSSAFKTNFSIPGFTLAFHKEKGDYGFLGGTFSITFNRINDFNRNITYEGTNPDNSIIDYFLEQANGYPPSQFDKNGDLYNTVTELAYDNYLIGESTILDPNNDPNTYFTDVLGIPYQNENIQTTGKQNQWSFAYGANFDDKFFLGAGIGFTSLRYKSTKSYTESFQNEPLRDLNLIENLEITGSGVNVTAGGIFRPVDQFQFGMSISSPTFYQLSDNYSATMNTHWNNFKYDNNTYLNNESASTDYVVSDYSLNTPTKFSAGATFFFNKNGFITADIERLNYAKAKYSSSGNSGISYAEDNAQIKSLYTDVNNYRVGGEFRYEMYRFRAGYNLLSDPFRTKQNEANRKIQSISGGLGYRSQKFYADLAVIYSFGDNAYRPYSINSPFSPLVTFTQRTTNVMVTLGFPF